MFTHLPHLPLSCHCPALAIVPSTYPLKLLVASVLFTLQANQCSPSCIHCHTTFNSLHIPPIPAQVNTCLALPLCDFWQIILLFSCLSKFIRHTTVIKDIPFPPLPRFSHVPQDPNYPPLLKGIHFFSRGAYSSSHMHPQPIQGTGPR